MSFDADDQPPLSRAGASRSGIRSAPHHNDPSGI
jgi:hypothetical protein